jgi:hypothetical protein
MLLEILMHELVTKLGRPKTGPKARYKRNNKILNMHAPSPRNNKISLIAILVFVLDDMIISLATFFQLFCIK